MREYASVSPKFWIGETGKALRGHPEAQVLALYLMTCPHANMIGVFHCPILYMAHETGLGMEGASKGLARLIEGGFCEYEEATDTAFVVRMAAFQLGEQLKPDDKRVLGVLKAYQNISSARMKSRFFDVYKDCFHIKEGKPLASPLEAPPKQLTGTGTGTGTDKEAKASSSTDKPPTCPHLEILDLFAKRLPELPQPKPELWNGARAKALVSRWRWLLTSKKQNGERYATTAAEGLAWFDRFFGYVAKSDFLMGRGGNWSCDLAWLVNETNFAKVVQGNYENREAA